MNLPKNIKQEILAQAKEESPFECCGLIGRIDQELKYFPCRNTSEDPENCFALDGYEIVEDSCDEVVGLVHSHPNGPLGFSIADQLACRRSGLSWVLVDPSTESWDYCEPLEVSSKIDKEAFLLPTI